MRIWGIYEARVWTLVVWFPRASLYQYTSNLHSFLAEAAWCPKVSQPACGRAAFWFHLFVILKLCTYVMLSQWLNLRKCTSVFWFQLEHSILSHFNLILTTFSLLQSLSKPSHPLPSWDCPILSLALTAVVPRVSSRRRHHSTLPASHLPPSLLPPPPRPGPVSYSPNLT